MPARLGGLEAGARSRISQGPKGQSSMIVTSTHTSTRAATRRLTRHCLATLLLAPLTQAGAQSPGATQVGIVNDVRGVGRESSCDRLAPTRAARGALTIARSIGPIPAWTRDTVMVGDRLQVQSLNDVHLRIERDTSHAGNLYLAPQLGRCPEVIAALKLSGISLSGGEARAGSYTISSRRGQTPEGEVERLILEIEHGGAYMQWTRGPLTIVALGREVAIRGTDLALIVDPDANVGVLYLREGSIEFAGARLDEPGTFRFGREGAAERITIVQRFVDNMRFHSSELWTRPLLEPGIVAAAAPTARTKVPAGVRAGAGGVASGGTSIWKKFGLAALAGGLGYVAYDQWIRPNPQAPRRRGTVVINIPL